jgi:XTP/dITP diphosphohydrolase
MAAVPHQLVIATRNPGKIRELRALLADLPIELVGADAMPDIEETGTTFAENAELKARAAAEWYAAWALADDSGLEVDALNGAPGVFSNRFAGEGTTEAQRNIRILELLDGIPEPRRTARYRAVVAVAAPDGRVWLSEGSCEGRILESPRGSHGFGYDPLFFVPDHHCTMAELDPAIKNRISHRARALTAARTILERFCSGLSPAAG